MSNNFICSLGSNISDIPMRLIDQTTYMRTVCNKYHTINTYLFCLILRCILGILIFEGFINSTIISILCLGVIIIFGNKFINNIKSWKNYLRIVIIYSIILLINNLSIDNDKKNNISGILIILDMIMGEQSRFIATNLLS